MAKKFYRYPVSEHTNKLSMNVETLIRSVDGLHKDDIVTKDMIVRRAFKYILRDTKFEDINDVNDKSDTR